MIGWEIGLMPYQLSRTIRAKRDDALGYYNLGTAYLKTAWGATSEDAISNLEQAVKLNPNYSDAWNNLGEAYLKEKPSGDAINAFRKVIKLNHFRLKAKEFNII